MSNNAECTLFAQLWGVFAFVQESLGFRNKNKPRVPKDLPSLMHHVEKEFEELRKVLETGPNVGFYRERPGSEPVDQARKLRTWSFCFEFCKNFIRTTLMPVEDPRVIQIRRDIQANEAVLREPLTWIQCRVTDNLTRIFHLCAKMERPASLKHYEATLSKLEDTKNMIQSLQDPTSPKYIEITGGLAKKNDEDGVKTKLNAILKSKEKVVEEINTKLETVLKELENDESYKRYTILTKLLEPFQERYKEVTSEYGQSAVKSGSKFEKLSRLVQPLIEDRLNFGGRSGLKWYRGVMWKDCPGEIDFVLVDFDYWRVLALVECKANPFDISAAFRQSGVWRDPAKRKISLPFDDSKEDNKRDRLCHVLDVAPDCPCFVITTVEKTREERFRFPVENKVKARIDTFIWTYYGREDIDDYTPEELKHRTQKMEEFIIPGVQQDLENQLSPLDCLKEFKDFVIVI